MIQNPQIAGNNFVLQNCAGWNVDSVSVIRDDNHRTLTMESGSYRSKWNESVNHRIHDKSDQSSGWDLRWSPTFSTTPLPNHTSPETVRWSNSRISGIPSNLDKKFATCRLRGKGGGERG